MFAVGTEVVLFAYGHPVQHNGANSPAHPCRTKILKVGRKYYTIEATGAPMKVEISGEGFYSVHTLEEGKKIYRASFNTPKEWRTPEFIEECIANL